MCLLLFFCFFSTSNLSLWYETNLANFGNCYTFNAANNYEDREAPRNVSLTGSTNSEQFASLIDIGNASVNVRYSSSLF